MPSTDNLQVQRIFSFKGELIYLECGLGRRGSSNGSGLLFGGDALGQFMNGKDLRVGLCGDTLDPLSDGVLLNLLNSQLDLVLDRVLGVDLAGLGGDGLGNLVLIIELFDGLLELNEVGLDLVREVVLLVILKTLGNDVVLELVAGGKVLGKDPRLGLSLLALVLIVGDGRDGVGAEGDGVLEVGLDGDVRVVNEGVCEERSGLGGGLAIKPNKGRLLAGRLVLLELEFLDRAAELEKVPDGLLRGGG